MLFRAGHQHIEDESKEEVSREVGKVVVGREERENPLKVCLA